MTVTVIEVGSVRAGYLRKTVDPLPGAAEVHVSVRRQISSVASVVFLFFFFNQAKRTISLARWQISPRLLSL